MTLSRIRSWVAAHRALLILTLIFTLIGLSWVIPPQASVFVFQRRLQELWILLIGALGSFGGGIIYPLFQNGQPALVFLMMVFIATCLAAFIRIFWSRGLVSRLILLLLLGINVFFGYALLVGFGFGGGLLEESQSRFQCEAMFSDSEGLRIISYYQKAVDYGFEHYFFLKTEDRGTNWQQIGYAGYEYVVFNCELRQRFGDADYNYQTCQPDEHSAPAYAGCSYLRGD